MKKEKAERLFYELGAVSDIYITGELKPRKLSLKSALAAGICAAAAITGIIALQTAVLKEKPVLLDKNSLPFEYSENDRELERLDSELFSSGAGYEAFSGYDVSDVTGANPIDYEEYEITELPVFVQSAATALTEDEMIDKFCRCAEALEVDPKDFHYSTRSGIYAVLRTSWGDVEISVSSFGTTDIIFQSPVKLPEEYAADDLKTYEYLAAEYSALTGLKQPVVYSSGDYSYNGEYTNHYYIYENSGDPFTALYNYNFRTEHFNMDKEGRLRGIFIEELGEALDCAGIYPAIEYDEAAEKLIEGKYVSSFYLEYPITKDMIKYCELTYHKNADYYNPYYLPYYRFLVEMKDDSVTADPDMKSYLAVYVPAVQNEYLTDIDTQVRFN